MAIGITARDSLFSGTDASAYTGTAFTPAASELLLIFVAAERTGSNSTGTPTITGHGDGTAWTNIVAKEVVTSVLSTTTRSIFVFACVTGTSPTSASVVATFATTIHGCAFSVYEVSGADEASGLVQTFVQSVTTTANPSSSSNPSVTLAAAGNANNRAFSGWTRGGGSATDDHTPRPNWTEIHDGGHATPIAGTETQWRSDVFETTASVSYPSATQQHGGAAWEIKAEVVAGGALQPRLLLLGVGI